MFSDILKKLKEQFEPTEEDLKNNDFEVASKNHIRIKTSDNPDNFEIARRIISARAKYRAEQREEFPETPSGMMFETVAHKKHSMLLQMGFKYGKYHENMRILRIWRKAILKKKFQSR